MLCYSACLFKKVQYIRNWPSVKFIHLLYTKKDRKSHFLHHGTFSDLYVTFAAHAESTSRFTENYYSTVACI